MDTTEYHKVHYDELHETLTVDQQACVDAHVAHAQAKARRQGLAAGFTGELVTALGSLGLVLCGSVLLMRGCVTIRADDRNEDAMAVAAEQINDLTAQVQDRERLISLVARDCP